MNLTSTATIVANTPGNFIIEVSIPEVVVMLVVDVYKIKKNMEKQGGAILRNSTGTMDIVWEENRQLAFSVTN